MNRVYIFNPENDIVLAHGTGHYTAPKVAQELGRVGALLMWWLADADDCVYMPPGAEETSAEALGTWVKEMRELFGHGLTMTRTLEPMGVKQVVPWGWNGELVERLERAGYNGLPDAARLRELSHRRTSRRILQLLDFPQLPVEARDWPTVERLLSDGHPRVLKMPWSSSGRGILWTEGTTAAKVRAFAEGSIRRQGSVMVEPAYRKLMDFAMLFHGDRQQGVSFLGYSIFYTRGANYAGNLVASDTEMAWRLSQWVPMEELERTRQQLTEALRQVVGLDYEGDFGVDMMICEGERDGVSRGRRWIMPCVELNLRMTMGVVARGIYRRLMEADYLPRHHDWVMKIKAACRAPRPAFGDIELFPANGSFRGWI